jgi:hypothetical protein
MKVVRVSANTKEAADGAEGGRNEKKTQDA